MLKTLVGQDYWTVVPGCRDAGIRVVMITGDHLLTGCSVAGAVGLSAGRVVAGDILPDGDAEFRTLLAGSTGATPFAEGVSFLAG